MSKCSAPVVATFAGHALRRRLLQAEHRIARARSDLRAQIAKLVTCYFFECETDQIVALLERVDNTVAADRRDARIAFHLRAAK